MDTREKIVPQSAAAELLGEGHWIVVVGRFDPLTAYEAETISKFAGVGKVLGIVLRGAADLLTAKARAVLVASLREVEAVTIAPADGWEVTLPKGYEGRVIYDPKGEDKRRQHLLQLILNKQQAE